MSKDNNNLKRVADTLAGLVDRVVEQNMKAENRITSLEVKITEIITNHLPHLEIKLDEIIKCFDRKYVRIEEFKPIKTIIYSMVGFILLSFLSAIVGLVIMRY